MNTFEVYVNNRKLCTAGMPELGVVTTILTWVARDAQKKSESMDLHVGGLVSSTRTNVLWRRRTIKVGDEIRVVVSKQDKVSKPRTTQTETEVTLKKRKLENLKRLSKELGYEIKKKRTKL